MSAGASSFARRNFRRERRRPFVRNPLFPRGLPKCRLFVFLTPSAEFVAGARAGSPAAPDEGAGTALLTDTRFARVSAAREIALSRHDRALAIRHGVELRKKNGVGERLLFLSSRFIRLRSQQAPLPCQSGRHGAALHPPTVLGKEGYRYIAQHVIRLVAYIGVLY